MFTSLYLSYIRSLGVSLYIMLKKKYPYDVPSHSTDKDYSVLLKDMKRLNLKKLAKELGSNKLTELLCGMLEYDPELRFTVGKVVNHRWVKGK